MNEPIDSKSSLQTMKKYYSSLAEMVRNLPKVKELDEAWVVTAKYQQDMLLPRVLRV